MRDLIIISKYTNQYLMRDIRMRSGYAWINKREKATHFTQEEVDTIIKFNGAENAAIIEKV